MRRRLMWTVAAAVTMVLLAMLVPMAVLMRDYAVEDRLSGAALEVQATESVVSSGDPGAVSRYVERINTDTDVRTTVLYPGANPGAIGPDPGEDARVVGARLSGQARVDDVDGGVQLLIPVSLNRNTAGADETPVIRVIVSDSVVDRDLLGSWIVLLLLGLALLGGALVLADRIGRSFVQPIRALADHAGDLGDRTTAARVDVDGLEGPPEVSDLAVALNRLVGRVEQLLERERAQIADLSHRLRTPMTALRLRVDALPDEGDRARLGGELDALQATVDAVVREARRSEREGLVADTDAVAVVAARVAFWAPLFEDLGRPFELVDRTAGPVRVGSAADDLAAAVDVLLDNVLSHAPDDVPARVVLEPREEGGLRVVVEDGGPGLPDDVAVTGRGESGGGSTGLGLAIVEQTATESGGGLSTGRSDLGGARVVVDLGGA